MESSYKSNFIGKTIIRLDTTESTNLYLSDYVSKNRPREGIVVVADYQSLGRGQNDRVWESEPGQNLLLSIYLKPKLLKATKMFYLNIITSLAVRDVIEKCIPSENVKIKWPNDIFVNDKKISGILIKNTLTGAKISESIIGIGININQVQFQEAKATSLKTFAERQINREVIMMHLFEKIEYYYQQLIMEKKHSLKTDYLQHLYLLNETHQFMVDEDVEVTGEIKGIENDGKLILLIDGKRHTFYTNTIQYL